MAEKGMSRKRQAEAPCKERGLTQPHVSLGIPHGVPTLYNPIKPSSLMTDITPTPFPPPISPATCSRILTISIGLVNVTCDAPPYK